MVFEVSEKANGRGKDSNKSVEADNIKNILSEFQSSVSRAIGIGKLFNGNMQL